MDSVPKVDYFKKKFSFSSMKQLCAFVASLRLRIQLLVMNPYRGSRNEKPL